MIRLMPPAKTEPWHRLPRRAELAIRETERLRGWIFERREIELGLQSDHGTAAWDAQRCAWELERRFRREGGADLGEELVTALRETVRLFEIELREIGEPRSCKPRDVRSALDELRRSIDRAARKLGVAGIPEAAWRARDRVDRERHLSEIMRDESTKAALLAAVRDARELFDAAASGKLRELRSVRGAA